MTDSGQLFILAAICFGVAYLDLRTRKDDSKAVGWILAAVVNVAIGVVMVLTS